MRPKNFILLFIFGLFLFLLPSSVEAMCPLTCQRCTWHMRSDSYCWTANEDDCVWVEGAGVERLGIIGNVEKSLTDGTWQDSPCNYGNKGCGNEFFPSGVGYNGQLCMAVDRCADPSCAGWFGGSDCIKLGVWDVSDSKCVKCSNRREELIRGNTSNVYAGCSGFPSSCFRPESEGIAGDGDCESACGDVDTECDEKYGHSTAGDSCGTGKICNSNCQCITVCDCTSNTVGGCCDGCDYCPAGTVNNGAGTCVTPSSTYRCNSWENCDNGECSATRRWYGCTGTSETCSASLYQEETVTASNGKVLTSNCSEVSPSESYYCDYYENCSNDDCSADEYYRACNGSGSCRTDNTYAHWVEVIASDGKVLKSNCDETSPSTSYYCDYYENCSSGDCSADKYYRACNGSGSCRTNNTYAHHEDAIASAGHSLTSSCGTAGSTLCDSTWRASSGAGDNHYGKGGAYTCQGMCNGSGGCEYAENCGVCIGTLAVSISGSGTCNVEAKIYPSGCSSESYRVKEEGVIRWSGTLSGDTTITRTGTVGVGSDYDYDLEFYIDGSWEWQDNDLNNVCSESLNNPPTCDYLSASPTSGDVPLSAIFTASGTDSDGTIAQYEFDLGDGSPNVYSGTAGTTHVYNTVGTYCAKLRVQDDDGAWSTNTGNCPGGTCTQTIAVTEAGPGISPPAVRTVPISEQGTVTIDSATIWGELTNMGGAASCLVWFEYKKSADGVWTKVCETTSTGGSFSCDLTDLTSNTTYDFEAFAKNGGSW